MHNFWSPAEEAESLSKRFDGINQAEFARKYKVPGGASMVSQHIKGRRPIGLEAAVTYAAGFGCKLDEISPKLAEQVRTAVPLLGTESGIRENSLQTTSPAALAVINQIAAASDVLPLSDWHLIGRLIERLQLLAKLGKADHLGSEFALGIDPAWQAELDRGTQAAVDKKALDATTPSKQRRRVSGA